MSLQSGKGDFPVYRGVSRQYGNGLGSIIKAALRNSDSNFKTCRKSKFKKREKSS